jgi:hypothetical protein
LDQGFGEKTDWHANGLCVSTGGRGFAGLVPLSSINSGISVAESWNIYIDGRWPIGYSAIFWKADKSSILPQSMAILSA